MSGVKISGIVAVTADDPHTDGVRRAERTILHPAVSDSGEPEPQKVRGEPNMSVGKSLIRGAQEALAIAKGELEPAALYDPENVDVAAIRKKLSEKDTFYSKNE